MVFFLNFWPYSKLLSITPSKQDTDMRFFEPLVLDSNASSDSNMRSDKDIPLNTTSNRFLGQPVFGVRFWKLFCPWFGQSYQNCSWSWTKNFYLIWVSVRSSLYLDTRKITEKDVIIMILKKKLVWFKVGFIRLIIKWFITFSNLKWLNKLQLRSSEVKCKNDFH